jgi:sugar phosphate isomerase/epimerase
MKCRLHPEGEASAGPLHLATERGRDEQMAVLERAIELCRYFGTDLVRGFAFWKQGELTETIWTEIEDAFRAPAALAGQIAHIHVKDAVRGPDGGPPGRSSGKGRSTTRASSGPWWRTDTRAACPWRRITNRPAAARKRDRGCACKGTGPPAAGCGGGTA